MEVGVATVYLQLFIVQYILLVYTPTDNKWLWLTGKKWERKLEAGTTGGNAQNCTGTLDPEALPLEVTPN